MAGMTAWAQSPPAAMPGDGPGRAQDGPGGVIAGQRARKRIGPGQGAYAAPWAQAWPARPGRAHGPGMGPGRARIGAAGPGAGPGGMMAGPALPGRHGPHSGAASRAQGAGLQCAAGIGPVRSGQRAAGSGQHHGPSAPGQGARARPCQASGEGPGQRRALAGMLAAPPPARTGRPGPIRAGTGPGSARPSSRIPPPRREIFPPAPPPLPREIFPPARYPGAAAGPLSPPGSPGRPGARGPAVSQVPLPRAPPRPVPITWPCCRSSVPGA